MLVASQHYNLRVTFFIVLSFHVTKSPSNMCLRASRTNHK